MFQLTKEEEVKIKSTLKERLDLAIQKRRNLFNFEFLDNFRENIYSEIEDVNSALYTPYNNIFDAVDNFNNNIDWIIDENLKKADLGVC